jgi:hypothetical protein
MDATIERTGRTRTGRARTALAALTAGVALALSATACGTGGTGTRAKADTGAGDTTPVTITFWHEFTDDREVAAVDQALAAFHRKYPYITVKTVKGQTDDKINQAIRGGTAPDVLPAGSRTSARTSPPTTSTSARSRRPSRPTPPTRVCAARCPGSPTPSGSTTTRPCSPPRASPLPRRR